MRRVLSVINAAHIDADTIVDHIELAYDDRCRRRIALTAKSGAAFMLDLPEAVTLQDGDGLVLEEGGVILVHAAPEDVAQITCQSHDHLARMAWHIGNRHLPCDIQGDRLFIRWDPVVVDMVTKLGGQVTRRDAPFNPEGGAYTRSHNDQNAHKEDR